MSPQRVYDADTVAMGAEALLREHPDALVCGLAGNGLIVPVPQSVGLWGQAAIEGRALIDGVVAGDRQTVVELWLRAQHEGAAAGQGAHAEQTVALGDSCTSSTCARSTACCWAS